MGVLTVVLTVVLGVVLWVLMILVGFCCSD